MEKIIDLGFLRKRKVLGEEEEEEEVEEKIFCYQIRIEIEIYFFE